MMKISLFDTGKRYNREWIFRHSSFEFTAGKAYAITGNNGSGKSTLLQVIGNAMLPSEGKIEYTLGTETIPAEKIYQHLSIAAPYLELPEEMTLTEFLTFHASFKPLRSDISQKEIILMMGLEASRNKQLRYFSSGMKQRVKLAQAIFSNTPLLLLDEPCSNLDEAGMSLYHSLITNYCKEKLIIVSSNEKQEYAFCEQEIRMASLKNNPG
ncbi:MAG: ABC transporter ATP-binding protein [Chitinophagaceae bacterium]